MRKSSSRERLFAAAIALSTVALALTVAFPHHHENPRHSYAESTCRLCKIQEGFLAAQPRPLAVALAMPRVVVVERSASKIPPPGSLKRSHVPRAPPPLS